jgi:hypothetical protein
VVNSAKKGVPVGFPSLLNDSKLEGCDVGCEEELYVVKNEMNENREAVGGA